MNYFLVIQYAGEAMEGYSACELQEDISRYCLSPQIILHMHNYVLFIVLYHEPFLPSIYDANHRINTVH